MRGVGHVHCDASYHGFALERRSLREQEPFAFATKCNRRALGVPSFFCDAVCPRGSRPRSRPLGCRKTRESTLKPVSTTKTSKMGLPIRCFRSKLNFRLLTQNSLPIRTLTLQNPPLCSSSSSSSSCCCSSSPHKSARAALPHPAPPAGQRKATSRRLPLRSRIVPVWSMWLFLPPKCLTALRRSLSATVINPHPFLMLCQRRPTAGSSGIASSETRRPLAAGQGTRMTHWILRPLRKPVRSCFVAWVHQKRK